MKGEYIFRTEGNIEGNVIIDTYSQVLAGIAHFDVADINGPWQNLEFPIPSELIDPEQLKKQYDETQGCYPDKHSPQLPLIKRLGTIDPGNSQVKSANFDGQTPFEQGYNGSSSGCL